MVMLFFLLLNQQVKIPDDVIEYVSLQELAIANGANNVNFTDEQQLL